MIENLIKSRRLVSELVLRDLRNRYTGSVLGFFWSVLNPLIQLALYTIVFSVVLKVRIGPDASPGQFAIYLFCGLLPWIAIHETATRSANCFIEHSNIIKKLSFPLETLPFSVAASSLVHQLLGTLVFFTVLVFSGNSHYANLIYFFPLILSQCLFMYGLSMLIASIQTFFRDVIHVVGVAFQAFFWATPIVYSKDKLAEPFPKILDLNPFTHLLEGYRWILIGDHPPTLWGVLYWAACCVLLYLIGSKVLKKFRPVMLDLI
jgi:ABC-type polysaccharide/polyol phosphate export permease